MTLLLNSLRTRRLVVVSGIFMLALAAPLLANAQAFGDQDIQRGRDMLKTVKSTLKGNYYDPTFRGLDLETLFKNADQRLKAAQSYGDIYEAIAQTLLKLKDSHTVFIPPLSSTRVEYGWRMQMIGDRCYIFAVKPGSDAEAKGLKPGDEIQQVFGERPTRDNIWVLNYVNNFLKHFSEVGMVVRKADGQRVSLKVAAEVRQERQVFDLGRFGAAERFELIRRQQTLDKLHPHVTYHFSDQLFIWKMPMFDDEKVVDDIMAKAGKSKALILDLRGNGGGYEPTLQRLVGHFFDRDVKIGDIKRRDGSKPLVAKGRGKDTFKGQLLVLVDSRTGSAAELFARVVQLEKRGTVIGDQSAGAVMRAKLQLLRSGLEMIMEYRVLVTDSDIIMADGKSLEGVGVTPDELMLPQPSDMAAQLDPVLSRVASMAGVELKPDKAGKLFPVDWRQYGFSEK